MSRIRESPASRRARYAEIADPEAVLAAGLRYLEVRARSVAETRRRLIQAGYRPELVDGVIDRLLSLGLLDDEAFARAWVESRDRAHPRGTVALKRELRLRGVDDEIIATVLSERSGDPATRVEPAFADEVGAQRLLQRRSASLRGVADPRARRQRAYALLRRNGFEHDTAAAAVDRFLAATGEGHSNEAEPGP